MKKIFLLIVAIAAIILSLFSFISSSNNSGYNYNDPDPIVAYYGCPTSKRIKKLNLFKKLIKK